ncbi:response regulator with CheY-like receiver domain and winged-helix DNA-binding domain [Saccharomonospora cyanea NA-134]|uniref:Response regulator with CheY-like receiver domain and winged-helix DNA-binding domain n=1 Tax=Saccharomonospora cyanea NA-134 TaxID=882082 RepID=H5XKP9_9PSEU|nr:response regulator with CheY-like receiver domain and winged-helix DNA-binding domain [Saccharomonospora cyanea NA-134]
MPVSRRALLSDVWGSQAPEGNVVQVYVYRLRKYLRRGGDCDPVIGRDRFGYRFSGAGPALDVSRLHEAVLRDEPPGGRWPARRSRDVSHPGLAGRIHSSL